MKQSGAVEACWAHNPEVRGSKPRSARNLFSSEFVLLTNHISKDDFEYCISNNDNNNTNSNDNNNYNDNEINNDENINNKE